MTPHERQAQREAAQRQAAMGRRVAMIQEGHMGGILKRWINADVSPIASLLRECATAYLADDMARVAQLLDMPVADLGVGRERPLEPLLLWCLKGKSPGRTVDEGGDCTHADDIVLAFMATAISIIAQQRTTGRAGAAGKGPSFSAVMAATSDAVRQTILGQFITGIQGAGAMQAIRERRPEIWKQKKSLSRICSLLTSQAKPLLRIMETEGTLTGHRTVLKVMGSSGAERMLTVTPPDANAWEIMTLCWQSEKDGSTSEYRSLWLGFTAMILAAAQRVGGWFEVAGTRVGRKGHTRTTKYLLLSEAAKAAIATDTERWVQHGFDPEPMVVPPEDGDYLTIKHRKVTGQRPARGLVTKAGGTTPWQSGATSLADTAWTVNPYALDVEGHSEEPASIMRIAAHARLAREEAFYLPTCMDFRGRVYYRTPWVSPQSGDLGKSLLCFPPNDRKGGAQDEDETYALALHMSGLYGGPDKIDKQGLGPRLDWWRSVGIDTPVDLDNADKPLTLAAHLALDNGDEWDRIPVQLDGTCNGLQHLSALFRDEEGAKHVNLVRSSLWDGGPADIYGVVASLVAERIETFSIHGERAPWAMRLQAGGLKVTRKLTKGPVMVLPYGGTREAVRLSVKAAVLDQLGELAVLDQLGELAQGTDTGGKSVSPWHTMTELGYGKQETTYEAFRGRDLHDHPGFNSDVGQLAGLVWESIAPAIPRAMAAMGALVAIAGWVGDRGISWRVGLGPVDQRLWVTQAKPKSSRKQVTMRGFHLPDMVRRLTLMANTNEVDERAHRTGIVANFIHSLDAAHLASTVGLFRRMGGGCVGSVHDCVMVRPSEAALMGRCLRETFVELYQEDPLSQPVRLIPVDADETVEYPSWYALADAAGVQFPERGSFDIEEVRDSAWFFS